MILIVIGLLVIWAALAVLGFLLKAALWLAVIGCVLFLATAIAGTAMIRNRH